MSTCRLPTPKSAERTRGAENPHIVEAVNWTTSEGGEVHYNRYFAHNFDEALGPAVRLENWFLKQRAWKRWHPSARPKSAK
ncbi:MAG: hypothetical protein WKF84_00950 [Pyrinomonadaceae bacterium]